MRDFFLVSALSRSRSTIRFFSSSCRNSLHRRYDDFLSRVEGYADPAQVKVLAHLAELKDALSTHQWAGTHSSTVAKLLLHRRTPARLRTMVEGWRTPRGLYVSGSVGTGKTALMDLFVQDIAEEHGVPIVASDNVELSPLHNDEASWAVRRTHFHRFMLAVHRLLHTLRTKPRDENDLSRSPVTARSKHDPLLEVAAALARRTPLICFDEFQVTDVADALVLHRLFR